MEGRSKKRTVYSSATNPTIGQFKGASFTKRRKARLSYVDKQLYSSRAPKAPEQKDFTFAYNGGLITAAIGTASFITPVNVVPAFTAVSATASNSRIGRRITGTHLSYSWLVQVLSSNYLPRIQAKVYYDKQTDGIAPAALDFKITDSITGVRELANTDRFVCLATLEPQPVTAGIGGGVSANTASFFCEGSIPLKGLETRFNALTSGVNSIESGCIWIVTYGTPDITTVSAASQMSTRYRFSDA